MKEESDDLINVLLDNLPLPEINDLFIKQLVKREAIHLLNIKENEKVRISVSFKLENEGVCDFLNLLSTLFESTPELIDVFLDVIGRLILEKNKELANISSAFIERLQKSKLN